MGRKSLKETRQKEIVNAFYTVAKREGLENTSIAKVAEHLDINPSLIIHYFKSKLGLEVALIDYILERYKNIYRLPHSKMDTPEDLHELIDRLFSRKWNRLISDGVFYSCYAKIYQDNKLRRRFRSMHDTLRQLLSEALENARRNDILQVSNIEELSERIYIILEGTYYYLGMVDDKNESEEKLKIVKNQIFEMLQVNTETAKAKATVTGTSTVTASPGILKIS